MYISSGPDMFITCIPVIGSDRVLLRSSDVKCAIELLNNVF